jgi:ABC-type nitrate/sulfonate/bicarbonate transport system ATPase subunit
MSVVNMQGASIEFRDLRFEYETGLRAIDGLTLDVPAGSTVGIVGPSGCGKSTLLGLVAGMYEPVDGSVTVRRDGSGRHLRSMMFQKDTLLPWLTVEQNAHLYYRVNKGAKKAEEARVQQLLSLAKIADFGRAYPNQLSGGMRRRVAFVAAVAPAPELLLLDEPFSSLDEPTRISIHQDVFRIIRELRMTTVLVTHDLAEAAALCDLVYVLTARPAKVFSRYEIPFGAERDMLTLRESPQFLRLYGELWHDLSRQMREENTDG